MPPRRYDPARDNWPDDARLVESQMASTIVHLRARDRLQEKRAADLERRIARFEVPPGLRARERPRLDRRPGPGDAAPRRRRRRHQRR